MINQKISQISKIIKIAGLFDFFHLETMKIDENRFIEKLHSVELADLTILHRFLILKVETFRKSIINRKYYSIKKDPNTGNIIYI